MRRNDDVATMMEIKGDFFLEAAPLLLPIPEGGGAVIIVIVMVELKDVDTIISYRTCEL